ncbi:MAG: glycosyltransferase family 4 protein [Acidimicrobiales bacterium]
MSHLLVTNDFPPKVGGIQSYLFELWRRLPSEETTVLTTSHAGDIEFDRAQPFRVVRQRQPVLVPSVALVKRMNALAEEVEASLVVLDPVLPLGLLGAWLDRPYALVLHGAEVTVPGRLPGFHALLRRALVGAAAVVAGGRYVAAEAERAAGRTLPITIIPPGVDTSRFRPLEGSAQAAARAHFGLPLDARLVVGVSRLVPRKGFDVLAQAAAQLAPAHPDLVVAVGGTGRHRRRLARTVAALGAPVRLLGAVPEETLPLLFASADVFAVPCRNRWGGLEQEGFGIVFLEAAAAGVPSVAGRSGGTAEAVAHGQTGLVVDRPGDVVAVAAALDRFLDDADLRRSMGRAGRRRAETEFSYDLLADRLRAALVPAD